MASRVYQTEAIVIKKSRFGEIDRLVTLYTPDYGKIIAIAKGAMRPKSKLGGNLELLTHTLVLLARGRNLDIITQAQTIDNFMALRENLYLISCSFYISELLDAFTEENAEDKQLFELILITLQELSNGKDVEQVLHYFELHLLEHLGYKPRLDRCVSCGRELLPEVNYFSPVQGGTLCRECGDPDVSAHILSLNSLKVLRYWQICACTSASRVKLSPELSKELKMIMRSYIKYILEKQLKSLAWLDELSGNHTR